MMWLYIIIAFYFVPMAVVLIAAAIHRADNDEHWYNMMGWLAVTPIVNIYIMCCIIAWYIWKVYHKVFKKKSK